MKQTQTLSDIATVLREIDKGKQWEFLTRQGNWTTPLINASPLYYLQNAHAIRIKPAEPDTEDWIPWKGGECPVPSDTSVEVRFPDGDTDIQIACKLRWKHIWNPPMGMDIIAYRLHKSEPATDPYKELREAHAAGKIIQEHSDFTGNGREWRDIPKPEFCLPIERYRVKPDPHPNRAEVEEGMNHFCPGESGSGEWSYRSEDVPSICHYCKAPNAALLSENAEPDADGWIPWSGGECPVGTGVKVNRKMRGGQSKESVARKAETLDWSHYGSTADIIAYRIAPEPEYIPLGPEDVPPGSVLRSSSWNYGGHVTPSVFPGVVCWANTSGNVCLTYGDLPKHDWQINRSIPLTGKWDPTAWEPCRKLKPQTT